MILTVRVVVNLDSDGRCDSPGHSAKYSTYNLMDEETGKVVAFQVVQVAEVTSSNATEKEEFTRCIQLLEGKDITLGRIATDRYVSITTSMAKDYPNIKQYDAWHLSKWVVKKLTNKANQEVVRISHHGYNRPQTTYGGLQQPAMATFLISEKNGSRSSI